MIYKRIYSICQYNLVYLRQVNLNCLNVNKLCLAHKHNPGAWSYIHVHNIDIYVHSTWEKVILTIKWRTRRGLRECVCVCLCLCVCVCVCVCAFIGGEDVDNIWSLSLTSRIITLLWLLTIYWSKLVEKEQHNKQFVHFKKIWYDAHSCLLQISTNR